MSADAQFRQLIDRILGLKEEQDTLAADIREVYAEGKVLGYDKTAMGQVVAHLRKVEKVGIAAIEEGETIFDLYLSAYERASGTAVATHPHETFPPHDAVTGELTEEQDSGRSTGAVEDTTSQDGSMGQEAGVETPPATATPEKVKDGEKDCNVPNPSSEGGQIPGTAGSLAPCTNSHPASALLPDAAGQTGGEATTPHASSPVVIPDYVPTFLIKKPAPRPHCLRPGENCGGQGVRHCHSCVKAMAESGVAA